MLFGSLAQPVNLITRGSPEGDPARCFRNEASPSTFYTIGCCGMSGLASVLGLLRLGSETLGLQSRVRTGVSVDPLENPFLNKCLRRSEGSK